MMQTAYRSAADAVSFDGVRVRDRFCDDENRSVEVVTNADVLYGLQAEWDTLVAESGTTNPFLSHAWICTWWDCFGKGNRLHVLLVRDGSRLTAIAPLMIRKVRIYGCIVHQLSFLENDHSPRLEFILGHDARESCRAIWQFLESRRESWDMLELNHLPFDSTSLHTFEEFADRDRYLTGLRFIEESPFILFRGDWETWFGTCSRNHRQNIRKSISRLARRGHVALETITGDEGLPAALEDGFRIEAAAWKDKAGTSIRSDQAVRRFYTRFAEQAADLGMLRLLFLTFNGTRIAFAYALHVNNRLYVLKAGYDPEYARYSPYQQLCYRVFRNGFAQGLIEYEFLGGNERWKLAWTNETKPHMALLIFRKTFRMRFLHACKCRLIPLLHRSQWYLRLRDAMVSRRQAD